MKTKNTRSIFREWLSGVEAGKIKQIQEVSDARWVATFFRGPKIGYLHLVNNDLRLRHDYYVVRIPASVVENVEKGNWKKPDHLLRFAVSCIFDGENVRPGVHAS